MEAHAASRSCRTPPRSAATGRPAAYAVVPGPGVLNTTAALATAWGVNAQVLCLTGQVPSQMIGKLRGKFHTYQGIRVRCTYHPAYLLRNPNAKRDVWDDMKIVMAELGVKL